MDWFLIVSLAVGWVGSAVAVLFGILGWTGRVAVLPWGRGTPASRAAGRNQLLLGLMIALNGVNLMLPGQGAKALGLLAVAGIIGYFALLLRHRHRYGPPSPTRFRFAEDGR
ncbi:hypothetical protein SAMN04487905_107221 [Actinopolyspora xinjiangensis]|uniref:Uncharacterized protein n=1 Tax=Actinopolyspora xinjiangensis TaxID=405564 RepID=A0A1H0UY84_9ACTN|nr:hypothetical protein [Actinopolyspora xinjiangensis]SDP71025.1 hypothetical protein SAMN04487905_107221 [Actinopolyspora xinjiangensis]